MISKSAKIRVFRSALNRESTTYELRQVKMPLKFALLSNSAKIPWFSAHTLRAFSAIASNHAASSPIGEESVHPRRPAHCNGARACSQ